MKIPFEWEILECNEKRSIRTARAKVYGGWIVNSCVDKEALCCESMVFIPDPNHEWEIE